ncbi:Uncharacterized protein Fot_53180 [Forsythia ovata]|uniref:Uncharacterized protein n=1 Tax=Forsythia ovata TaxID=205694 RepID=A0ABD1PKJ6_9LAMI
MTGLIAIAGVVLGWITIEIACKPCLEKGWEAIDCDFNPDYDLNDAVDDRTIYAPLNPDPPTNFEPSDDAYCQDLVAEKRDSSIVLFPLTRKNLSPKSKAERKPLSKTQQIGSEYQKEIEILKDQ